MKTIRNTVETFSAYSKKIAGNTIISATANFLRMPTYLPRDDLTKNNKTALFYSKE